MVHRHSGDVGGLTHPVLPQLRSQSGLVDDPIIALLVCIESTPKEEIIDLNVSLHHGYRKSILAEQAMHFVQED